MVLNKFVFAYNLSFEDNKKRIMSEYKYPESMIDLVYVMYVKYHEHNGLEAEIK